MTPIVESFPPDWEVLIYDNGLGVCRIYSGGEWEITASGLPDLSVYARYAAIDYASHDLIVTQDDDCIVSDPEAIVAEWEHESRMRAGTDESGDDRLYLAHVVCNMPQEFRHDFYTDHALVGFGAVFHRGAWKTALRRFGSYMTEGQFDITTEPVFMRTCDIILTGMLDRVLVDVPKTNAPFASDPDRMWKQPTHVAERTQTLELVKAARAS